MTLLKLDKLSLTIEKTIYAAIYISFFISIPFLTMSFDNYIPIRYEKNWNSKIITDIKFIPSSDNCTETYEEVLLGYWSGFDDGCFCRHSISNETFAFSSKCQDLTEGFSCNKISSIPMVEIRNYLGGKFCVKKTEFTFMELYRNFSESLKKTNNELAKMTDKRYNEYKNADFKNNEVLKSMIPKNVLVDLKLSDKVFIEKHKGKIFDGKNCVNLDNYSKSEVKTANGKFNFYTKYYSDLNSFTSIDDISNLITDVHLYNFIWCAFLDLAYSSRSLNGLQNKFEINHGFAFCDNMIWQNDHYYNEGYKRNNRISIKENSDLSVLDFYTPAILNYYFQNPNFKETQNKLKNRVYPDNSVEPMIVAERFYDGFGCRNIEGLSEHISKMRTYKTLRILSIFVFILVFFILISDIFIYFIIHKQDNFKLKLLRIFILVLFGTVNFLLIVAYFTAKDAHNYFTKYIECQNNLYFDNFFNSVSPMEESFYYSYKLCYEIAISLWLVSSLGFISSLVYVLGIFMNRLGIKVEGSGLTEQANTLSALNSLVQG